MRKGSLIISIAAFLLLVLILFLSITVFTGYIQQEVPQTLSGYTDLSDFDLDTKLAYISPTSFLYYSNELYTPEDFMPGKAVKEPYDFDGVNGRFDPGNYGTYHIVLNLPHKGIYGFSALCSLFSATVLLTPPIIYTGILLWFQLGAALVGIYIAAAILYNVFRKTDNRHTEHVLIFIGALVFITLSILDIQIHRSSGQSLPIGLSETGMMVFIYVNMIALALQFSRTEAELDEAHLREKEMQETNVMLDKMSQLKSDFLANISHEMRTPLTIMSSYAGLTVMQLRHNAVDEKTIDNLATVKREAIRLAGMVEQLKEVALEKERKLSQADVEVGFLLKQAVDFCKPICQKNKNRLFVAADSVKGILHVNAESIFQTLVNLIINANRHTKEGLIQLKVQCKPDDTNRDFVVIMVCDDGDGIEPELLHRLFQRGVSGDGSTGLGLAISREIIEENGGEIWAESKKGKGTAICFTLPYSKGKETE